MNTLINKYINESRNESKIKIDCTHVLLSVNDSLTSCCCCCFTLFFLLSSTVRLFCNFCSYFIDVVCCSVVCILVWVDFCVFLSFFLFFFLRWLVVVVAHLIRLNFPMRWYSSVIYSCTLSTLLIDMYHSFLVFIVRRCVYSYNRVAFVYIWIRLSIFMARFAMLLLSLFGFSYSFVSNQGTKTHSNHCYKCESNWFSIKYETHLNFVYSSMRWKVVCGLFNLLVFFRLIFTKWARKSTS